MYEDGTYVFTVDHVLRVFKSNADDFGAGPDPTQTLCGTNDLLAWACP